MTLNGVEAYRFAIDASNVEETELDVASIDSGAIYVAKDGAYIIRLEMAGRGTNEALSGGPLLGQRPRRGAKAVADLIDSGRLRPFRRTPTDAATH